MTTFISVYHVQGNPGYDAQAFIARHGAAAFIDHLADIGIPLRTGEHAETPWHGEADRLTSVPDGDSGGYWIVSQGSYGSVGVQYVPETPPSLYERAVAAGLEMDHHETDLYLRDCQTAREIVRSARRDAVYNGRPEHFFADDGTAWLGLPFAYDPGWQR